MIKVNCIVNSADEKAKTCVSINSVDKQYNAVELSIEGHSITVYADDIIQAVENCRSNGTRRRYPCRSFTPTPSWDEE